LRFNNSSADSANAATAYEMDGVSGASLYLYAFVMKTKPARIG